MADYYVSGRKGSYGGYNSRWSTRKDEDFEEVDVWGVVSDREDSSSPKMGKSSLKKGKGKSSSSSNSAWKFSTTSSTSRMTIPPAAARNEAKLVQQSSTPVKIPDWSKIYGKIRNEIVGSTYSSFNDDHGYDDVNNYNYCDNGDDIEPPHEWLAKKLARSQISSFSVCEGIGRTLKGRDLSKVRNAVLTKTGFLE